MNHLSIASFRVPESAVFAGTRPILDGEREPIGAVRAAAWLGDCTLSLALHRIAMNNTLPEHLHARDGKTLTPLPALPGTIQTPPGDDSLVSFELPTSKTPVANVAEGICGLLNLAGVEGLAYTTYIAAAWPQPGEPPSPRNLKGVVRFSPERSVTKYAGNTVVFENTGALAYTITEVVLRALGEEEAGISRVVVQPFGTTPDYP
jgi:hypothetical protein